MKGGKYGTTLTGGKYNVGTAFKLTSPAKGKTAWTLSKLYDFKDTATYDPDHSDAHPYDAALTAAGDLIVETEGTPKVYGGPANSALVMLAPSKAGQPWTETIIQKFADTPLNSFTLTSSGTIIGAEPYVLNKSNGSIWQWTLVKGKWTSAELYGYPGYTTSYGQNPLVAVELDKNGALYGTTSDGGTGTNGTVFKLTPSANKTAPWALTVLYSFPISGAQGQYPKPYLTMDTSGSLEGSTIQGSSGDTGAIFKLTPSVNGKTWTESVIYNGPQLETGVVIFGASGENPLGIISGDSTSPGIFFMLTKPAAVAKGVARPAVSGRPITYAPGYKFVDSLSLSAGPSS